MPIPSTWTDWIRQAGRPLIMAIVNVTPDSFSDGGAWLSPAAAIEHARQLVQDGADLLDIGGESTRPGSAAVSAVEQCRRVVPVIEGIRNAGLDTPVSIDTQIAEVAAAALDAGATIVNDISALRTDPAMAGLVAERKAPLVLMHMQGTPATMQQQPSYADVVAEVAAFLRERADYAVACGIARDRIAIDPGIGLFGKTTTHNLELLRRTDVLAGLEMPVLVGPSRKRFIGEILNIPDPSQRDIGTLGAVASAVLGGASILRVHEVSMTRPIIQLCAAIRTAHA